MSSSTTGTNHPVCLSVDWLLQSKLWNIIQILLLEMTIPCYLWTWTIIDLFPPTFCFTAIWVNHLCWCTKFDLFIFHRFQDSVTYHLGFPTSLWVPFVWLNDQDIKHLCVCLDFCCFLFSSGFREKKNLIEKNTLKNTCWKFDKWKFPFLMSNTMYTHFWVYN